VITCNAFIHVLCTFMVVECAGCLAALYPIGDVATLCILLGIVVLWYCGIVVLGTCNTEHADSMKKL
jgi:hypothetical protein